MAAPSRSLEETARHLAGLADAAQAAWERDWAAWEAENPDAASDPFLFVPPIAGGDEKDRLAQYVSDLPDDDVFRLTFLMYLGRGDFSPHDLAGGVTAARHIFGTADRARNQMLEKAPLGEYLRAGLDALARSGQTVDRLVEVPAPEPAAAAA